MTHDYKRHGTTTLFAALDVLEGKVIGLCMQRHRHQEFIRFLNAIEAQVPARKFVHVIFDNYATHKHPNVRRWLDRHPRFAFHFTPTSCQWTQQKFGGVFVRLSRRRPNGDVRKPRNIPTTSAISQRRKCWSTSPPRLRMARFGISQRFAIKGTRPRRDNCSVPGE
jgi:hypothetical protein